MPHSRFITALYKKIAGTILFLDDFPDNSLMHLGRNDCNFRAYCKFGKSEIAKIFFFSFWTKNRENFEIKRTDDILSWILHVIYWEDYPSIFFSYIDMQQNMKIYNYVV